MQYKRYSIEMELTGLTGKKAAEALSKCFEKPIEYNNTIDEYTVKDSFDRDWTIGKADGITCQRNNDGRIQGANYLYSVKMKTPMLVQKDFSFVEKAVNHLHEAGAITNDTTKLSVHLDAKEPKENYRQNILNIMQGKGDLIYKAVQSSNPKPPDMTAIEDKGIISFPMFNSALSSDRINSYVQLSQAINNQAIIQNKVSPKQNDSPNEKFTFRTWLIRLGMVGQEFKTTRSFLMENLEGNTAWNNPEMANKPKDIPAQAEDDSLGITEAEEPNQNEPEEEILQEQDEGMSMSM